MDIPLIQIDAFAEAPFEGNPAAVMPLVDCATDDGTDWLDDVLLQRLAQQNNLSETAFYTSTLPSGVDAPPGGAGEPAYHLRWFTPAIEVTLCGHATLATAAQIFEDRDSEARRVWFHTLSGWLSVTRDDSGRLTMDFPADVLTPVPVDPSVETALGATVAEMYQSLDLVCVVDSAGVVAELARDLATIAALPQRGVVVTAPADGLEYGDPARPVDFVSRWFGARAGVPEDPVTGSAHTQLAPYWARRLGRDRLVGRQLSARGGTVACEVVGERVLLSGGYRRYLDGVAHL